MPNQDILDLQPTHIQELQNRYEQALAEHGYDSLLIASGAAPYSYRDDQTKVFQAFGPFLQWTGLAGEGASGPLVRPAHNPALCVYKRQDFCSATPGMAD